MTLALTHANVVDVRTGAVARDVCVLIADSRIAAVATEVPPDADVVDTVGAYVVPGFNDMHAHVLELADPTGAEQLMLAFGVTGYRQMSGSAALLARRAAGGFAESEDAPSVLQLPGDLLSPLNASTAHDVTAAIRAQKQQGADFIKMGMVTGAVYPAAQTAANEAGMPLGGHLPATTRAEDTAAAGIRFIEHLGPGLGLLASCVRDGAAVPPLSDPKVPGTRLPFMEKVFALALKRIVVNPMLRTAPDNIPIMRRALDAFSDEKARQLAEVLRTHKTWQCPTLIREKANELGDLDDWHHDPNLRFMSPKTLKLWRSTARKARALPDATRSVFHDLYAAQQRLAGILVAAGVPMLAGSDVTGASWEIPGASLHQEFDELAASGFTPLQVLQSTTSAPAGFTGRDDFGAIEPGRRADLVLLREDPTQSVAALHGIVGVVRNGMHRSEAQLTAMKDRIAREHSAG